MHETSGGYLAYQHPAIARHCNGNSGSSHNRRLNSSALRFEPNPLPEDEHRGRGALGHSRHAGDCATDPSAVCLLSCHDFLAMATEDDSQRTQECSPAVSLEKPNRNRGEARTAPATIRRASSGGLQPEADAQSSKLKLQPPNRPHFIPHLENSRAQAFAVSFLARVGMRNTQPPRPQWRWPPLRGAREWQGHSLATRAQQWPGSSATWRVPGTSKRLQRQRSPPSRSNP